MPLLGYGQPVRRIVFSKEETPLIVKNWRVFPLEIDGRLAGIHFLTAGVDTQQLVLTRLTEKYGQAIAIERRPIQNTTGAQFEAVIARWNVQSVHVEFTSPLSDLHLGEVYIDLPEAAALRRVWRAADGAQERPL
jgi:hypothetical protein